MAAKLIPLSVERMMFLGLVDKLLFGALLLGTFQISVLSDHYLQFISGYYEATKNQVEGFELNARMHEYSNVDAMIQDLLQNSNSVVRTDAQQKLRTMDEFYELESAIGTLKEGNVYQQAFFMFNPQRLEVTKKVYENFTPGLPLSWNAVFHSVLFALGLSILLMWPVRVLFRATRVVASPKP